jgi:hypothetical protein
MGEKFHGLGIAVRAAEDEFAVGSAAQSVGPDGQATDGDIADGEAAKGIEAENESAKREQADAKAAERDYADGNSSKSDYSLSEGSDGDHAGGDVANGDDAARVAASLVLSGIGADGDADERLFEIPGGGLPSNWIGRLHPSLSIRGSVTSAAGRLPEAMRQR